MKKDLWITKIVAIFTLILCFNIFSFGTETKQRIKKLVPVRADTPPVIDGKLEESIWKGAASVDDIFISYNPTDGDILPFKTKVWLAYDPDNLYFAFHCFDDEPEKIKTSITKRDNMWSDDWIGLAIDTSGNRQFMYELFINPSGMQGDIFYTPSNGENLAPDYVWYSGGKIVSDGYTVEVKVPLKSLRFKYGKNVPFKLLFWRRINRLGVSGAWPALKPGEGQLNSTTEAVYGELKKQRLIEFIPTVTYGSLWDLQEPSKWSDADDKAEIGISGKFGVTSNSTLDFTINPDFSQVESDAFQITHNRRYPIFYSEKRPFFMEAGDLFNLSGSHNNLWAEVHTRKIVDPSWGLRYTGNGGKLTYGVLVSEDKWAGRDLEGAENFYLGKNALYTIGRMKYSLSGDSFIGALYSGKELGDFFNRSFGVDSTFRFGKAHTLRGNVKVTNTFDPETDKDYKGNSYSAGYSYSTKSLFGIFSLEKFDRDFRMDTAFYRRTGITRTGFQIVPVVPVKSKKLSWLKSVKPVIMTSFLYDEASGIWDKYYNIGVVLSFIMQGNLTLAWNILDRENWNGFTFDKSEFWGGGSVQLNKWLWLHTCWNLGTSIYYDENPFLGFRFRSHSAIKLQPLDSFSFFLSYEYTDFRRDDNKERVYDYHIVYTKTAFQPSKHLSFRMLVQYDSYIDTIMSDILASYEFVPGTVFHIGYGSMNQNLSWDPRERKWLDNPVNRRFYNTKKSFFVKCSYRLQL